jgi:hypothetical protein
MAPSASSKRRRKRGREEGESSASAALGADAPKRVVKAGSQTPGA